MSNIFFDKKFIIYGNQENIMYIKLAFRLIKLFKIELKEEG